MKNREKYAEEIKNYNDENFCKDFIQPVVLNRDNCKSLTSCGMCAMLTALWLDEEYTQPETDWNKVEVNTPILVRHDECDKWSYRYFAKYENGVVYAWHCGYPNWAKDYMVRWEYAKLAKSEDKCEKTSEEEPEVDWSKVAVDTPILVRNGDNEEWNKRYFARYENETIYVWSDGRTSWSAYDNSDVTSWEYVKLAEREVSDE